MIPTERSHLYVAASTHPGMVGKNNEDRHAVDSYEMGDDQPVPVIFAIVSDGIGGHQAGEVAAGITVEEISQSIRNSDASTPIPTLREAIKKASQFIRTQSESDLEKRGMGATCACAWIIGDRLYIAYAGDSRIYLIRQEAIQQLTKDHTWIQDALDVGILDIGQAQKHPNAHVIRRYLGSTQPIEPDTRLYLATNETDAKAESNQGLVLFPGDQIILCSDGLTDLVHQDEIRNTFASLDQKQALDKLIDMANQRGGHDNITIVALKVPSNASAEATAKTIPAPLRSPKQSHLIWKACLLIPIIICGTTISILGGYLYLKHIIPIYASPTTSYTSIPAKETTVSSTAPTLTVSPLSVSKSPHPSLITTPVGSSVSSTIQPTLTAWPTNTLIP